MKLLTKSTYYFLVLSFVATVAGGGFLYLTIKKVIYRQIDSSLKTEKSIIEDQIRQSDTIPDFAATFGHQIEVKLLNNRIRQFQAIRDTDIYDPDTDALVPFRYIYFCGNTNQNKGFVINIYQTISEKNELLRDIGLYLFFLFFSLLLITILINYLIARELWKPFYESVKSAGEFDIQSDQPLELPSTNIEEFNELNDMFRSMTSKMRNDYLNLKEFNENASHEIQTPLAVIRSKTDLLMQQKKLNKESLNLVKAINEATTKLFKLNQGLLLISKIDNQVFHETKSLSLKNVTEKAIDNYREILDLREISVEEETINDSKVLMNETLAEILISNLLSNAVRFNECGGFIRCRFDKSELSISNSGPALTTDPENLFRRFHKHSDNPQSVGLGLSIVRKIAESYGMTISYTCSNSVHTLLLKFKSE